MAAQAEAIHHQSISEKVDQGQASALRRVGLPTFQRIWWATPKSSSSKVYSTKQLIESSILPNPKLAQEPTEFIHITQTTETGEVTGTCTSRKKPTTNRCSHAKAGNLSWVPIIKECEWSLSKSKCLLIHFSYYISCRNPNNVPCKLISNYIPPTEKKHGAVIQAMRDKMLRNSSMVAQVTVGMPRLKPKKSLQRVEIGAKVNN